MRLDVAAEVDYGGRADWLIRSWPRDPCARQRVSRPTFLTQPFGKRNSLSPGLVPASLLAPHARSCPSYQLLREHLVTKADSAKPRKA